MTWFVLLLLSWLWAGSPLAQMWPNPGPGRAASGGGAGFTQLAADPFGGGNGGLGANWTTITSMGIPSVSSGGVIANQIGGADSASAYTTITWPNDQYAQVQVTTLASVNVGVGPVVRSVAGALTHYRATVKGPFGSTAVIRIEKWNAGTYASLTGNVTITLAANDVVRLTVTTSGANAVLTALVNGVSRATFTDTGATNGAVIASGQAGLCVFVDSGVLSDGVLDNWAGGSIP